MTPEERRRLERVLRRTTEEQGVPYHLEDPATIRKVVALLLGPVTTRERSCR